jgi:hypothetical protein
LEGTTIKLIMVLSNLFVVGWNWGLGFERLFYKVASSFHFHWRNLLEIRLRAGGAGFIRRA